MVRRLVIAVVALVLAGIGAPMPAHAAPTELPPYRDLYTFDTQGQSVSRNGRVWRTSCEKYSPKVERCRTEIIASVVKQDAAGRFTTVTGWTFNNLTYVASLWESQWAGNPLARTGTWTAADGRQWRTECDTALTGRGGCRSYIVADVLEPSTVGGRPSYRWVKKEIFNSQVRFLPAGMFSPLSIVDEGLRDALVGKVWPDQRHPAETWPLTRKQLDSVTELVTGPVSTWRGMPQLRNLATMRLGYSGGQVSFEAMPVFPALTTLSLQRAKVKDFVGMPSQPNLAVLDAQSGQIQSLRGLPAMPKMTVLDVSASGLVSLAGMTPQPKLERLAAAWNPLGNLNGLPELPALKDLGVSGTFTSFAGLRSLPALEEFSISAENRPGFVPGECRLTSLAGLPALPTLKRLTLTGCPMPNLSGLRELPSMTDLTVIEGQLSAMGGLTRQPSLRVLNVHSNKIGSYSGADYLWTVAPKLSQLGLHNNPGTDRASLKPLVDAGVDVYWGPQ